MTFTIICNQTNITDLYTLGNITDLYNHRNIINLYNHGNTTGLYIYCNITDLHQHGSLITNVEYILCVAYVMIAMLTLFGNGLVITTITRFKHLRTNTNIYILFLSTSDIMVSMALLYSVVILLERGQWKTLKMPCLMRYALFIYSLSSSLGLHVGKVQTGGGFGVWQPPTEF